MTLVVTPRDNGGVTLDELNVPLFFDGFGPAPAATPQPAAPATTPAPTTSPSASPTTSPSTSRPAVRDVAPLLLSVRPGRGFASAAVDVTTRSTLTGQLLRGNRIVGSKRVTVRSGTQRIKVVLQKKVQRQLRRQGLKCVTLKLRIVVAAQASGSKKKTFTRRVVVRL